MREIIVCWVALCFCFMDTSTALSQLLRGAESDSDSVIMHATSFVNLEEKLPTMFGYHVVMEGVVPQTDTEMTALVVLKYHGEFDSKKKLSLRAMQKRFFQIGEDFPYSGAFNERLQVNEEHFERYSHSIENTPSDWSKVKAFSAVEMMQNMQPWNLSILNAGMMSKQGPIDNTFAKYIAIADLTAAETNERGFQGTWLCKPSGAITWKMTVFFEKAYEFRPTFCRFSTHDSKLKGEALLDDKGSLAAETRSSWKRFGDLLLPLSAESKISRDSVRKHEELWKVEVDWLFGKDLTETFAVPESYVDEEKLRGRKR